MLSKIVFQSLSVIVAQVLRDIASDAWPPASRGSNLNAIALAAVGSVAARLGRNGSCDAGNQTRPSLVHRRDAVPGGQIIISILVKRVDVGLCELSRWHALREEDVKLIEGAVLGLGETEECPDKSQECGRSPDKSGVSTQIPC